MTPLQRHILTLLSERWNLDAIACDCGISEHQVLMEVASAFHAAGFNSLAEVETAIEKGFDPTLAASEGDETAGPRSH